MSGAPSRPRPREAIRSRSCTWRYDGLRDHRHLNNAGSSLPTTRTLDAVTGHLRLEADIGGYEAADAMVDEPAEVRSSAAALVGASSGEIAFTTSGSMAWLKSFWDFVFSGGITRGHRVVVDRTFSSSHYLSLLQVRRVHGIEIVLAPFPDATVDVQALSPLLDERVALVSITIVPTHFAASSTPSPRSARCYARSRRRTSSTRIKQLDRFRSM